jgi:hypothetical protein
MFAPDTIKSTKGTLFSSIHQFLPLPPQNPSNPPQNESPRPRRNLFLVDDISNCNEDDSEEEDHLPKAAMSSTTNVLLQKTDLRILKEYPNEEEEFRPATNCSQILQLHHKLQPKTDCQTCHLTCCHLFGKTSH